MTDPVRTQMKKAHTRRLLQSDPAIFDRLLAALLDDVQRAHGTARNIETTRQLTAAMRTRLVAWLHEGLE